MAELNISPRKGTPLSKTGRRYVKWEVNDEKFLEKYFSDYLQSQSVLSSAKIADVVESRFLKTISGLSEERKKYVIRSKLVNLKQKKINRSDLSRSLKPRM